MARLRRGPAARGAAMAALALVLAAALVQAGALVAQALAAMGPPGWAAELYGLGYRLLCMLPPALLLHLGCRQPAWPPPAEGGAARGARRPLWPEFALFIGAALAFSLLAAALRQLLGAGRPAATVWPVGAGAVALRAVTVCAVVPLLEEWLFRGGVQRLLRPLGPRFAMVRTAGLFALMHSGLWDMLSAFFLGLLLCAAMERRRSLALCAGLHAAYNALALLAALPGASSGESFFWVWAPAVLAAVCLAAWLAHVARHPALWRQGPAGPAAKGERDARRAAAPALAAVFLLLAALQLARL